MLKSLSEALEARGFDTLTPVQEAVSAEELINEDLLVSAQTGSGKTVGFGIAIAPTLLGDKDRMPRAGTPMALVVAPTRELAFQVMQELRWLYERTGAVVTSCVGGMDVRQERRSLERGAHIVVGTPGRLCDHIRRGALDLSDIRAVVLDEADEMLDLGFREDLEFILDSAPKERRTLLFSATVSPVIAKLAETYQRDAKRINTMSKSKQHADITYSALRVGHSDSDNAIFNLLRFHDGESAIVFANTRSQVNHLTARLSNRGLSVVSLSGELSQSERTHALQAMRDGRARVCVATDVAARGIDLPNLNLVIHADLPTNTESLLHRSGRTGRAGRKGISALIIPPKVVKKAERLLKWAKITAEWGNPPSADEIIKNDEERLLNDPNWTKGVPEANAEFAQKLLDKHGAEAVAAMLVDMYQSRHGAPEELQTIEEKAPRDLKEFGPSRWFSLSVGRNDRAEPRWLLPMLLRATNLEKAAIGAIRVQDKETYLEVAEASANALLSDMGDATELEDGIQMTALDNAPDLPQGPRKGPGGPRGGGAKGGFNKREGGFKKRDGGFKDRGPRRETRDDFERPARKAEDKPARAPAPREARSDDRNFDAPKPAKRDKPKERYDAKPAKPADKPKSDDKPKFKKNASDPSKSFKKDGKGKPRGKPAAGGKPSAGGKFDKPKTGGAKFSKGKPPARGTKSAPPRGGNEPPRRRKP